MSRAALRMATSESGPGAGTWHEKRALLQDGPPSYVNLPLTIVISTITIVINYRFMVDITIVNGVYNYYSLW